MTYDDAYEALTDARRRSARWAFGTGFDDPLAGVDTTVPDGVDPADLGAYCLMLGDDALVSSQRLTAVGAPTRRSWRRRSRWPTSRSTCSARPGCCSPAPARSACSADRDPAGDRSRTRTPWPSSATPTSSAARAAGRARRTATSPARSSGCSSLATWRLALFARLRDSRDPVLAAIAAKGVKELAYHRDYAAAGCCGSATARRSRTGGCRPALDAVWPLRRRAVHRHATSRPRLTAAGVAVDPATLRDEVATVLDQVLARATLTAAGMAGRRRRRAVGRTARTPSWPGCSPSCRAWRARTRRRPGDAPCHRTTRSARRVAEAVTDPGAADAHPGRPRRAPRRARSTRGTVVVEITPTYSGCPAMEAMRADLRRTRCSGRGFADVEVRTVLAPAWTTDWITQAGRRKLAEAGHRPARSAPARAAGPVPLQLGVDPPGGVPARSAVADTEELSEFGATACKALRRCRTCREPFEHVKEI